MDSKELKPGTLVEVKWIDILEEQDLTEYQAAKLEPAPCVSYGILLLSNVDKIIIYSSRFHDAELRQILCFPRSVVTSLQELGLKEVKNEI
jgi:hypothetical protein